MKKLIFIALIFCYLNSVSQDSVKAHSVYYLLDTTKTPPNENMWEFGNEGPAKYFTLHCPCLQFDREPTFDYRINSDSLIIRKSEIGKYNPINIKSLIQISKRYYAEDGQVKTDIFFIEPRRKKYVIHKVYLIKPTKPVIIY